MMNLGDTSFIQAFRSGDHKAFAMVFERYYKVLCAYVYKIIKEVDLTDDIVQDLFVTLWQKRNDFESLEKIVSFLFTSARNASFNYCNHKRLEKEKLHEYLEQKPLWESNNYWVIEEFDRRLDAWLEALPIECRKVIELSLKGKNNLEIADLLNISVNTVKNQKVKGYKILRKFYRDEYLMLLLYLTHVYLKYI